MKKNMALSLVMILLLSFCMTSCASEHFVAYEEYRSYNAGTTGNQFGIPMPAEIDYWQGGDSFDKEDMAEQSCSVLGTQYVGSYSGSKNGQRRSYVTDYYDDEESGVEFGLRSDTGELVYVNFMNSNFWDVIESLPDVEDPYKTALSLGTELAEEIVGDLTEYTLFPEEPYTNSRHTEYSITFAKKIQEYWSYDYITVRVSSKGMVMSATAGEIGSFDHVTVNFDESAVEQSILERIDSIYQNSGVTVSRNEISKHRVVLTPEGEVGIFTEAWSYLTSDDADEETGVGIRWLTIIGRISK